MKHLKTFESFDIKLSKEEMIQKLCNYGWEREELEMMDESELEKVCGEFPDEMSESFYLNEKRKEWIKETKMKKGALHKQLGYKEDENIPDGIIKKIVDSEVGSKLKIKGEEETITALMKKRANLAKTLKKLK